MPPRELLESRDRGPVVVGGDGGFGGGARSGIEGGDGLHLRSTDLGSPPAAVSHFEEGGGVVLAGDAVLCQLLELLDSVRLG